MTATLGFLTVGVFLALTLWTRASVLICLVLVPITFALIGGYGSQLGTFIGEGVLKVAPVAVMIAFAVLYFSLMVDLGLFDPVIKRVLNWAGGDPMKITVGTAVVTLLVALDGDGASTFLIAVSAFLPIYQRIGMRPLVLTGVVALAAGVMNMIPWGGPTVRAMAALDLTNADLFVPVLPAMGAGIAWVLLAAYLIGRRERSKIGVCEVGETAPTDDLAAVKRTPSGPGTVHEDDLSTRQRLVTRARQTFNVVLTVALVIVLLFQLLPLEVAFVVAFALAVAVNMPTWQQQRELFEKHGGNVVLVVSMIFAAGVLTGILSGTGMIKAMAEGLVGVVPDSAAGLLAGDHRRSVDAAEPGVHARRLLLRCLARARRDHGIVRRRPSRGRQSGDPGPDDDRLPAQPADRVDVHSRRHGAGGAGQASALHLRMGVRHDVDHDGGGAGHRRPQPVRYERTCRAM